MCPCLLAFLFCMQPTQAEPIQIPNGSFEFPKTRFVSPQMDAWNKTPRPEDYDETGGFFWNQLTGLFQNTAPGSSDHIDNCDRDQAVWLFAVPEVGLFQEAQRNTGGEGFQTTFEVGRSYQLTVGVMGGGGGMPEGSTLELSLYYRGEITNAAVVASISITNSHAAFPNHTHLTDYSVSLPTVQPGDVHAGKPIGIRAMSTVSPELQGGYWDLDNVRLEATDQPPLRVHSTLNGSNLVLSWNTRSGYSYHLRQSLDLRAWIDLGVPVIGDGEEISNSVSTDSSIHGFFRVVEDVNP